MPSLVPMHADVSECIYACYPLVCVYRDIQWIPLCHLCNNVYTVIMRLFYDSTKILDAHYAYAQNVDTRLPWSCKPGNEVMPCPYISP